MNVSSPGVNVTLDNGNDPDIDGTLANANGLDVYGNQINWTPPHIDFPHYQLSFLNHPDPFYGVHLLPLTPNLLPVCLITPTPHVSRQITRAPKHLILFGAFGMTPLQGKTVPFLACAPYLHAF